MKITGNIKYQEENFLTVTSSKGKQTFITSYFEDIENNLDCSIVFYFNKGETTPRREDYFFRAQRNGKTAAEIEKYFINEFTKVVH